MISLLAILAVTAAAASPSCTTLTETDALLVIDVQNDFLEARPASQRSPSGPSSPTYHIPSSDLLPNGWIKPGSLAVPNSSIVVDRTQQWYEFFANAPGKPAIFASQDYHPFNHCSFCRNGTEQTNPDGYHPDGAVCFSGKDVPVSEMNATNRCLDGESEWLWNQDKYVQWPDHCRQGTFGSLFDPYLGVPSSTVVVQKGFQMHYDSYSAFGGLTVGTKKPLADMLTESGIKRLWILGVALDYCVQQSTLDALGKNPGTGRTAPPTLESVVLVRSATAAVNKENGEISVQNIIKAGGHVVDATTVSGAISEFCSQ